MRHLLHHFYSSLTISFLFFIATGSAQKIERLPRIPNTLISGGKVRLINGVSVPSDFPAVDIKVADNPDSGYIFLSTWGAVPYIMILDNKGTPIFYKRMLERSSELKVQPNGLLTHYKREGLGAFVVLDSTYTVIDTIRAKNGLKIDEHDLLILPDGHILLIAREGRYIDMSKMVEGGHPQATVFGNHVQELDAEKNVVFTWRCWDHFKVTDAVYEDLKAAKIDYVHMNAIDLDNDGNILISSRNLSEITKINRQTGEIIWRLGGANNQFIFVNDSLGFSYQHSIRALPNGNYILFDNGNYHEPPFSRAVEYQLNSTEMTATLVWEYRNDPDYFARWLGNVQRLPNGNTLINWAYPGIPKLTEIRPDGSKAYELDISVPAYCYRTFRFPWKGRAAVPYLIAESHKDRVRLIFNKFGDNGIRKFIIYGGESPNPTCRIDSTSNNFIDLNNLPDNTKYYFRVTAIDSSLQESAFSNQADVVVRFIEEGENLVCNGDFLYGTNFWDLNTSDGASAQSSLTDEGEYHLIINNGGPYLNNIQLVQNELKLGNGRIYKFEFDAYAENARVISIAIMKIYEPWTDYGKIGYASITNRKKLYTYEFKMDALTDFQSRLVFNCGGSNADLYMDNITLIELPVKVDKMEKMVVRADYELYENYPNPFNLDTIIRFSVPVKSKIEITVYNVLGEMVDRPVDCIYESGIHKVTYSASLLSSGIYFFSMKASSISHSLQFNKVRKMTLIK